MKDWSVEYKVHHAEASYGYTLCWMRVPAVNEMDARRGFWQRIHEAADLVGARSVEVVEAREWDALSKIDTAKEEARAEAIIQRKGPDEWEGAIGGPYPPGSLRDL